MAGVDLSTKVAIALFLLGAVTWLIDFLFGEDIKALSRYARIYVFLGGLVLVLAGFCVLVFWPSPTSAPEIATPSVLRPSASNPGPPAPPMALTPTPTPAPVVPAAPRHRKPLPLPKKGDVLGSLSASPPTGGMPQKGDVLGSFNFNGVSPQTDGAVTSPPNGVPPLNPAGGNCNNSTVTGSHNSLTNNCPTINLAPKPELRQLQSDQIANPDGTFTTRVLVEWSAEYAGDWRVLAYGKDVISVEIPAPTAGWSGKRDGFAFATINRPNGRYTILIQSSSKSPVELKYELH